MLYEIDTKKIDNETIEQMEEFLALAKAGKLRSIMYVVTEHDGSHYHGWSGLPNDKMVAGLEGLKFDLFMQKHGYDLNS